MRSALKVWRCAGCLHRWLAPRKPSECHECGDWRIFRYFGDLDDGDFTVEADADA